jgi:hypothetical protein
MKFVEEGSMRSLTAGLARQAMVAGTMGVLLIAALAASPNFDHRTLTASASFDKPIPTRAIVIADAPPAPLPQAAKATAVKPTIAASKPAATARVHIAATEAQPRPRPADHPQQVATAANPAPDPAAEPPFDLRKRLFAPVSFVRDNVVRLISWP